MRARVFVFAVVRLHVGRWFACWHVSLFSVSLAVQAWQFAEQAERGRAGDSSAQVVIRRLLSVFNKVDILIYHHFSAFSKVL